MQCIDRWSAVDGPAQQSGSNLYALLTPYLHCRGPFDTRDRNIGNSTNNAVRAVISCQQDVLSTHVRLFADCPELQAAVDADTRSAAAAAVPRSGYTSMISIAVSSSHASALEFAKGLRRFEASLVVAPQLSSTLQTAACPKWTAIHDCLGTEALAFQSLLVKSKHHLAWARGWHRNSDSRSFIKVGLFTHATVVHSMWTHFHQCCREMLIALT